MMKSYDTDTSSFMKEAITGAEMTQEVGTSRDPYLPPTQPQSPNVTPGSNAASYPNGGNERPAEGAERVSDSNKVQSKVGAEHSILDAKQPKFGADQMQQPEDNTLQQAKPYLSAAAKMMSGGDPRKVLAKAVIKGGLNAILDKQHEQQNKTGAEEQPDVLSLYNKLNHMYGNEWHDWELETISQTLVHDTGDGLSADGVNIVGALQVVLNTNQAHEDWLVFEKVGHAFNGNMVDFSGIAPLEPHECALTIRVINKLRNNQEYDTEVVFYVVSACKLAGLTYLPETLFPMKSSVTLKLAMARIGNDEHLAATIEHLFTDRSATPTSTVEENQIKHLGAIESYVNERVTE